MISSGFRENANSSVGQLPGRWYLAVGQAVRRRAEQAECPNLGRAWQMTDRSSSFHRRVAPRCRLRLPSAWPIGEVLCTGFGAGPLLFWAERFGPGGNLNFQ